MIMDFVKKKKKNVKSRTHFSMVMIYEVHLQKLL